MPRFLDLPERAPKPRSVGLTHVLDVGLSVSAAEGLTRTAGDYVIAHAGTVVRRVEPEEVFGMLGMYEVVLAEAGEDPIVLQES